MPSVWISLHIDFSQCSESFYNGVRTNSSSVWLFITSIPWAVDGPRLYRPEIPGPSDNAIVWRCVDLITIKFIQLSWSCSLCQPKLSLEAMFVQNPADAASIMYIGGFRDPLHYLNVALPECALEGVWGSYEPSCCEYQHLWGHSQWGVTCRSPALSSDRSTFSAVRGGGFSLNEGPLSFHHSSKCGGTLSIHLCDKFRDPIFAPRLSEVSSEDKLTLLRRLRRLSSESELGGLSLEERLCPSLLWTSRLPSLSWTLMRQSLTSRRFSLYAPFLSCARYGEISSPRPKLKSGRRLWLDLFLFSSCMRATKESRSSEMKSLSAPVSFATPPVMRMSAPNSDLVSMVGGAHMVPSLGRTNHVAALVLQRPAWRPDLEAWSLCYHRTGSPLVKFLLLRHSDLAVFLSVWSMEGAKL
ncbi:hypothetical protein Tco_1004913 [Tanacetum coccineum]|uniref:Uncharacterized protein n=1 Tax=Tanacetum coccineum TaxID=301880 RepID=A0ABQ5FEK1_9ASTR